MSLDRRLIGFDCGSSRDRPRIKLRVVLRPVKVWHEVTRTPGNGGIGAGQSIDMLGGSA